LYFRSSKERQNPTNSFAPEVWENSILPRILLVEDDDWWISEIEACLNRSTEVDLRVIATESQFLSSFEQIATWNPHLVILDVMLKWAEPGREMPSPPEEVRRAGHYRAGLRCLQTLRQNPKTEAIPVILYTVTTPRDLESDLAPLANGVRHVQKGSQHLLRRAVFDVLKAA